MSNTTRQPHADERLNSGRRLLYTALAAAALTGLIFSPAGDQGFLAIVFLGPLMTGVGARLLGVSWKTAAGPWALSGVFMLAYDGVVNSEDVVFHAVLTILMVALVALGTLLGRPVRRLFSNSAVAGA